MTFPQTRMRRLRRTPVLRSLVRETRLTPANFIYPMFVQADLDGRAPIDSMPGQYRWGLGTIAGAAAEVAALGIPAVLLFGLPDTKDEQGSGAYDPDGIVQRAVRHIKDTVPGLLVITDTCLDEYTSHGHCGVIRGGAVDNDATLELLAETAVTQAAAGADIVAPSDMMDGRVSRIRRALDERSFLDVPIMSYSAKFASAFYGPFRDAADCAPQFGDRSSYQIDPANSREAARETVLDVEEGADMIIIKPALSYLDIIRQTRDSCAVPIAAYNVSGEYAMVKSAGAQGWLDERITTLEILTSIQRAGADMIITYHACEVARWIGDG